MLKEINPKEILTGTDSVFVLKDDTLILLENFLKDVRILIDTPEENEKKQPKRRRKRTSGSKEAEIIKAYNCGEHTIKEVMEMTGCSYATVRKYIPANPEG